MLKYIVYCFILCFNLLHIYLNIQTLNLYTHNKIKYIMFNMNFLNMSIIYKYKKGTIIIYYDIKYNKTI